MIQPSVKKIKSPDHQQIDKLIVDVVHKMKNNLGGITGFAALLQRDLGEETPEGKLIEQIKTSALRLDDLILDLMTLIRNMHICKEKLHLVPILQQKLFIYEDECELKCPLRNTTELSDKDIQINSDPIYLDRLLKSVITLVNRINSKLKQVEIFQDKDLQVGLKFHIYNPDIPLEADKNLTDFINQCESVEARLALYSSIRLADQLNCEILSETISNDYFNLNLTFKQELIS